MDEKHPIPDLTNAPPWLALAANELGVTETPGVQDSPRILEYLKATNIGSHVHDETPWCSAFINWCMSHAGIAGTRSAAARSWLDWGVPLLQPKLGCVVVLKSPTRGAQAGHVTLLAEVPASIATTHTLTVLGGNQHNQVCVERVDANLLLGLRWPSGYLAS